MTPSSSGGLCSSMEVEFGMAEPIVGQLLHATFHSNIDKTCPPSPLRCEKKSKSRSVIDDRSTSGKNVEIGSSKTRGVYCKSL